MKNLPLGNFALSIAHPAHELRLYGFMEKTKPFVFVMTDGSGRNNESRILNFQNSLQKIHSGNKDAFSIVTLQPDGKTRIHIKDLNIYSELLNGRVDFFEFYIKSIMNHLIRKNIDFLVTDASEGYNVCHEICAIMSEIAVKMVKKQTGKTIILYDYALSEPADKNLNDDCICIELDDEAVQRKKEAIMKYPVSILEELKSGFGDDIKEIPTDPSEASKFLTGLPSEVFNKEYIRPVKEKFGRMAKPFYETYGQKLVTDGVYEEYISYDKHIAPIKRKLEQLVYEIANP